MKRYKVLIRILLLGLLVWPQISRAQIEQATIGVNGLTCSQCSRSVSMALQKLSFVRKVNMNLAQTQGTVWFRKGMNVDLDELAQAARNAGFSTRFVRIRIDFSKINPGKYCFQYQGKTFYFLKPLPKQHSETMVFQIINKGFLAQRKLRKYTFQTKGTCKASEKYYLKAVKS